MIMTHGFLLPEEGPYLLNHSVGCLSVGVKQAAQDYFELWQTKGGDAWGTWFEQIHAFHCELSLLFSASANEFCYQNNISSGLSKIIHALPHNHKKNIILVSDLDFPTITFLTQHMDHLNLQVCFVPSENGKTPQEVWEKHFTDDVLLAIIPHVTYGTSYRNDVATLASLLRQKNIFSVIDVAQSAGVVPLNFTKINADFVVGSCVKWLCGGTGAGFLWTRSGLLTELSPKGGGWFAKQNIFSEEKADTTFAATAWKFMDGTPNPLPMTLATAAIKKINSLSVEKIHFHNQMLIDALWQQIGENKKFKILSPQNPQERGGTFVFSSADDESLLNFLLQAKIFADRKKRFGIRLSPHIYNQSDDIHLISAHLKRVSA